MTRSLVLSLLALGAACGEDGSDYPIIPGGGGPPSGTGFPDAGAEGDASSVINGRVCVIADPRSLTSPCATSGAEDLTVTLGSQTANTAANGAFVITRPPGSGLVWRVSGAGIEPSALPLASSITIPALASTVYTDMLAATNAIVIGGNGVIIAQVGRMGTPTAGITALATPQPDSEVYYDGASVTEWEVDATGASGIIWIPSLPTGSASLALDSGTAQATITNIQVFADTISFAFGTAP